LHFVKTDLHFPKAGARIGEVRMEGSMGDPATPPLRQLSDDDLEFVQRMVLASGSLKELAQGYGVSYPTIRSRLDKLLERLRGLIAGRPPDPMAELLADLIAKGEIAPSAARAVLKLHRELLTAKGD
jgi:hypothetical protein